MGSNSTVVVGAYAGDDIAPDTGSVYVYTGTHWETEQEIMINTGTENDRFGYSVAVSGDGNIIAVGVYMDDGNGPDAGAVYVCSGQNWSTVTKLTASDGVAGDYLGYSVDISADGSRIAAGAYGDDEKGPSSGSVYIFDSTWWAAETKIVPTDGEAMDMFGRKVAISSDGYTIVAGAYGDDGLGMHGGAVYIIPLD
jgi:hypothetical protein